MVEDSHELCMQAPDDPSPFFFHVRKKNNEEDVDDFE